MEHAAGSGEVRAAARKRVQAKADAWRLLAIWVALTALFIAIWVSTTPGDYFWPAWPIAGVGIGVVVSFIQAFAGPVYVTEARIDAELRRMGNIGG